MATIANLVVKLSADSRGFASGLAKAKSGLANLGGSIARIAGGAALGGAGFGALIRSSLEAADALNDLRLRSGLSTEFLSAMKQGLELAGSNVETLAGGFRKLQRNVTLALEGNKKALQLFKDLGIEIKAFSELSPDDQVRAFAEALSKVEDPAKRNTLLVRAMGGAAATLGPAFLDGAKGLQAMEDQAQRTGQVVSTSAGESADRALDAWKLMTDSIAGLGKQAALSFAGPIADALEQTTSLIQKYTPNIRGFFAAAIQNAAGLAAIVGQAARGNFAGALEIDRTLKSDVKAAYDQAFKAAGGGDQVQKQQLEELKKISRSNEVLTGSFRYGVPAVAQ